MSAAGSGDPRSPHDVQRLIDENLKRVYRDVLDDEFPDRFRELLAQLGAQQGRTGAETSEDD